MARAKYQRNGRLEDALTNLIQSQAILSQNQASQLARIAEMDRINSERFARIEAILLQHSQILAELSRAMQQLPEAVREEIGFKAQ
jgi:hypothetical protein